MDNIRDDVQRFRAEKRIDNMMVFGLNVLSELREAQGNQIEKLGESLLEMEESVKLKYNIDLELAHLAKHAEFLDESQAKTIRKRFLDYGGQMRREL